MKNEMRERDRGSFVRTHPSRSAVAAVSVSGNEKQHLEQETCLANLIGEEKYQDVTLFLSDQLDTAALMVLAFFLIISGAFRCCIRKVGEKKPACIWQRCQGRSWTHKSYFYSIKIFTTLRSTLFPFDKCLFISVPPH